MVVLSACATEGQLRTTSKDLEIKTEAVRSDLESKQADLKRELKETRQLAAELQSHLREIKDQDLSGLQGRLEQDRQDLKRLQGRLEDQAAQVSALLDTAVQKLSRQLESTTGRTNERAAEIERTLKVISAKLSAQVDKHEESLSKLDTAAKQMDLQIKTLSAQVTQFQGGLTEFSKVLHALTDKSADMDRRVTELAGRSEGQGKAVITQLNEVTRTVGVLTKSFESVQAKTGELSARVAGMEHQGPRVEAFAKTLDAVVVTMNDTTRAVSDLKQVIEASVGKLAARVDEQGEILNQVVQRIQAGSGAANGRTPSANLPTHPPAPAPGAKPVPDAGIPDKEAYDRAYLEFTLTRYESAVASFRDFLLRYPDSSLVPNAHFWIAECYFRTHDYARGIESYEQVVERYPKSGKASAALYRKALALLELKDKAAAKTALRQLIADYPKSDESARARDKLASLR